MLKQITTTKEFIRPYLVLAEALHQSRLDPGRLPEKTAALPSLTHGRLTILANRALAAARHSPRQGWAVMAVSDAAAQHQDDPSLAALAAWHLGRLANEYGRPRFAAEALQRAQAQFTALNQSGWLAAATWQRHALCWASPDLSLAVEELQAAVRSLQTSPPPLNTFVPHCRLTLAYAQLLKGDLDHLPGLLDQCRKAFTQNNDRLHLARTLFVQSGYLRRTAPFHQAKAASEEGLALAKTIGAAADIARFHCQIGYNHWLCDGNYDAAAASFQTGIEQFRALDIPGWLAQCQDGLAQIYIMTGRLAEAEQLVQSALTIFQEEEAVGQQPPAYLTAGWLETLKGRYQQSLDCYHQAEAGCRESGKESMVPVVQMHQGETYIKLGRYQQALQKLEQAYDTLETLNLPSRLAECGLRLAHLWSRLDHPKQFRRSLESVKTHAEKANHASALLAYHFRLADYHFNAGQIEKTLQALTGALDWCRQQNNPSAEAECRRRLAEVYNSTRQLDEAAEQLTLAETAVKGMGLPHEQAACLLVWGHIYRQQDRAAQAQKAWSQAEQMSRELMPDINWQAAAALAQLAEETGASEEALARYRQMIGSLRLLRQGFWQPELSGSYLKRPSLSLNRAVLLCAKTGRHPETLAFIEETKAQTTGRRIQARVLFQELNLIPANVRNLMAEIRWLQENLRTTRPSHSLPTLRSDENQNQYVRLREKIDAYTDQLNRLQRERVDDDRVPPNTGFDLEQFRRRANRQLGADWAALDYYRVDDQLVCLLLTADTVIARPIHLPNDFLAAVKLLSWPRTTNGKPPISLLKDAGNYLIPPPIRKRIREKSTLIIAPHRDLHRLPWAALHFDRPRNNGPYRPLVDAVTPVIVPSLQTLSLLWQRAGWEPTDEGGLILAVSDFQGRHTALPAVRQEVEQLAPYLGKNGRLLQDNRATAAALLTALGNGASYDYWHIASHAFHDEHSGRLSGLALYDEDLWLDELWQLAPLPGLVTFSACGSSKSRLFEGDEHVGLTTTCLTAGANHVIGSIWDVPDKGMAPIMRNFYSRLLPPKNETAVPPLPAPVARALAQAQRHAWKNGENWQHWAGFRCTGRP